MSEHSKIEWTDHTFNICWGCQKVSDGCKHCYAEALAKRYGFSVWGPAGTTERRVMSAAYWKQPLRWNKAAAQAGTRARVFCCSMADVFEDHPTNEQERPKLWTLIEQTPWLDWLLLTKRPGNILGMIPYRWHTTVPQNVWYGTSVEHQAAAEERIPLLLTVPAAVRFLSCEPLLGPVDVQDYIGCHMSDIPADSRIHWIIAGGESGPGARPMHPDWARSLRDQCQAAAVAFHFKQWGNWLPDSEVTREQRVAVLPARVMNLAADRHGPQYLYNVGKGVAGRMLDGCIWDEFPEVAV